jgi:hypothetical protein
LFAWLRKERPDRDWYWAASPEDRHEYDAFGPWVDAVRSEAEMPPRFRAAYQEHRGAHFLLKVPIAADRLAVRPGMNLYRLVLAVHDDRLSLLRLAEGRIATQTVVWADIAAVRSSTNLLHANWALLLKDGNSVAFDYNTVSSRRLDAVTGFIRDQLTPGAVRPNDETAGASLAIADLFYQNMLMSVRNGVPRPVVPLHFEPRDRPCRDERNRRRLSTGLLILDATEELVIVDRGLAVRRYFHPTYAVRTTFIPYATMTWFSLASPPPGGKSRFSSLSVGIDRQVIVQPSLAAPERVVACLAEHGVRQVAAGPGGG